MSTNNLYVIYKITSPSGKSYIGQTNNMKRRITKHKSRSSTCRLVSSAIQKYGWDNIHHEILLSGLSIDEANIHEPLLIIEHSTLSPAGYNLKSGGITKLTQKKRNG